MISGKAGRTGAGQPLPFSLRPMLVVSTRPTCPIRQRQSQTGLPHLPPPPLLGPAQQRGPAAHTEWKAKGWGRGGAGLASPGTRGASDRGRCLGKLGDRKWPCGELRAGGTLKEPMSPLTPTPQKVLSLSQCLCPHGASGGRMGPQSPAAYLGGLKEYCMCPQELRSERQCAQRGRTERQRQEKDAKCKNRLETARHPNRSPRQPGRTAGHTRLDPPRAGEPARRAVGTGDLQASGGLGSLAPDKPGCVSAPGWTWRRVSPHMPTWGSHQAGPKMPAPQKGSVV